MANDSSTPTRRRMLLAGGATAAGAVGAGAMAGVDHALRADATAPPAADPLPGTIPFHGAHQSGIATRHTSRAAFLALDLHRHTDREAIIRMLRLITQDAARLTQGATPIAGQEAELAAQPHRLTVTFGFGPELVDRAGMPTPSWLKPLPAFGIDRLQERFSDGDLLLQVAADDALPVAHAVRMLLKDLRSFARVRWIQNGFRDAAPVTPEPGTTGSMRNLFGQVDGSANALPDTDGFDRIVWIPDGPWSGGTSLVLRRIAMDLDTWDELDRGGREKAIGRRLDSGAPLTGTKETDSPDFTAADEKGFPVIPEFSHLRRARGERTGDRAGEPRQEILRRSYNYDDPPSPEDMADGALSRSGLIFAAYQRDVDAQYIPIQKRLDHLDLLNTWTTPIGSAVFAIPPGCGEGEFIGQSLLE